MLCISCIPTILTKTMLKMTQSFCRYTRFICEIINYKKTHVKTYSFWSCQGKTCLIQNVQNSIGSEYTSCAQQVRLLANIKKRVRHKRPQNSSSVPQSPTQMTNQLPRPINCNNGNGDDGDNVPHREAPSTSAGLPINKRRDFIPPNFRRWEYVNKRADGSPFRFKVVSYNVLAQYLLECHPYLYTACDPEDLQWDVRSERIFDEIMNLEPDILCLQEVQRNHLNTFFSRFEDIGYSGIFKQKTGHREDGCAIYYKKDVFCLEAHQTVEYFQPEFPLLNRDNVGLIVKLVPLDVPHVPLVVATTHLLYNPLRTDVRLAQMQVLLAEIDRFAYFDLDGLNNGYYPIILTGDFNSTPNSVVIRLVEDGILSPVPFRRDRHDWRMLSLTDSCQHLAVQLNRSEEPTSDYSTIRLYNSDTSPHPFPSPPPPRDPDPETLRHTEDFNTKTLTHPLRLTSVYPHYKRDHSPEATTFQDNWVNVDYIHFSCCNKLRLIERLRLPTAQECEVLGTLPNDVYGSDHLVLAAHFELRDYLRWH